MIEPDKREPMLHVKGQAQPGGGVLPGVVGLDPVCVKGVSAGADSDKNTLF